MDRRAITGAWKIKVNGNVLDETQFYHRFINDESNRLVNITEYIREGKNEVEITVTAQKESDGVRDPLYLLGKFGVDEARRLTAMPEKVYFDSHYIKGFPYYSGKMTLEKDITLQPQELPEEFDLRFDFADECLDCLEVRINGQSLGVRAFTPYRWTCRKDFVKPGKNHLELVRTNTLANMLDGTYFDYEEHKLVHI